MSFDTGIYPRFVEARVSCLLGQLGKDAFKGKHVLEAGCGYGYAGELLENVGAIVCSSDARKEHIQVVKKRYPGRSVAVVNYDHGLIIGEYDVVVALGLLYHLEKPGWFIKEACKAAPVVCLESLVVDAKGIYSAMVEAENGFDQGVSKRCKLVSPAWVQEIFQSLGFDCEEVKSTTPNVEGNCFDWKPKHDQNYHRDGSYLRRIFIAKRRGTD